jgi:hypothetical protein
LGRRGTAVEDEDTGKERDATNAFHEDLHYSEMGAA